jgi:type IV pilus assembly protein PilB
MEAPRVRLGELLVKSGLITEQQLDEVLGLQRADGRRLGTLLVESGLVSETQVTQILSQQLSIPWVSLHHIDFSRHLLGLVPEDVVRRYCLIPIYVRRVRGLGDALYVAMDDPSNSQALAEVAEHSKLHVRAMIAPPSDILAAIRAYYGGGDEGEEEEKEEEPEPEDAVTAIHQRVQRKAEVEPEPEAETDPESTPRNQMQSGDRIRSDQGSADPGDPAPDETPASAPESAAKTAPSRAAGKQPTEARGDKSRSISLTLLDGTTIQVPSRPGGRAATVAASAPRSENAPDDDQLTARDLVAAWRAAARGADTSEIIGEKARWESVVAALLSVLLRKHLISDWEFIEELKKG